ncbi:LysR family transcriptional regulator [Achromobacter aegrifaciens]
MKADYPIRECQVSATIKRLASLQVDGHTALFAAPHFDLVDLRLFVRVAEANSLTQGAERVFLSPAAASLRIKGLEEALGAQLLYRIKRGVSPTLAGKVFLQHARKVLIEMEQLQAEMQLFSRGIRGHVRLFANTTAISEHLPYVLAKFFETHGFITVDLQERLSLEIVRAVHEGMADIGVISTVQADGLETIPYRKNPLVLAAPIKHPLSVHEHIQFSEALTYEFIWLDAHSATHTFLQQEVSHLGLSMRQRIQVGSFDAMCRMIHANVGIGVLPEIAARRHAASNEIKIIQLTDPWAIRELRICIRKREELPIYTRALLDFILQSC